MKNSRHIIRVIGMALVVASVAKADTKAPVMRDVATHEQLSKQLLKAEQQDPAKSMTAVPVTEDPSVVNRPQSLISRADMVSFGGNATLIPKRAILQLPENFADRVGVKSNVKIRTWEDFYALNRAWITTIEVSRVQAEGNQPLADATKTQITKSGNLIVATYQGGPISVLPLKAPDVTLKAAQ